MAAKTAERLAREKARAAPPDLEAFLVEVGRLKVKWFFIEGHKVRTRLDGVPCCPVQAVGWARSAQNAAERVVPDGRNMASAARLTDRQAASAVHHADDIITSRYYKPALRESLLKACGLQEAPPAD